MTSAWRYHVQREMRGMAKRNVVIGRDDIAFFDCSRVSRCCLCSACFQGNGLKRCFDVALTSGSHNLS